MKVINRTGQKVTWAACSTAALPELYVCHWSHPNQTHEMSTGHQHNMMVARAGDWHLDAPFVYADFLNSDSYVKREQLNTTAVVLVNHNGKLDSVNWSGVLKKWNNEKQQMDSARSGDISKGLEAAQVVINGLATGIAALGPYGALPSGALLGLGSLILMAMGMPADEPDQPPTIEDITEAVQAVVKDELLKSDTRMWATRFRNACNWCVDLGRLSYEELEGTGGDSFGELSDHDIDDFKSNLESLTEVQSPFREALDTVIGNPKLARYILPAFASGLAADAMIWRLHLLVRHFDGTRITAGLLEDESKRIAQSRDALGRARDEFEIWRDGEIKKERLQQTPEAEELRQLINTIHLGQDTLDFVASFDERLAKIQEDYAVDSALLNAGKEPTRVWNPKIEKANKHAPRANFDRKQDGKGVR